MGGGEWGGGGGGAGGGATVEVNWKKNVRAVGYRPCLLVDIIIGISVLQEMFHPIVQ